MRKIFLLSTAVALVASAGLANAQTPGASGSQSAPDTKAKAPVENSAPMNRGDAPDTKAKPDSKGSQADQKMPATTGSAQRAPDEAKDGVKSKGAESKADSKAATEMKADKSKDGVKDGLNADSKGATDTKDGMKPKAAESKPDGKAATEMKADKDGVKADSKGATDTKTGITTGQAPAGARQLNTEQRTSIRTVIKEQNVKPVTNVNFSISVGTQVPRTVTFHPVPRQLVTIYPDWQGYEYFLVKDQIIVVNPRTMQIVAVLEA
jgi:hypothetical protein